MTGIGSFEDLIRSAEEAHGALPDATAAVEAAHAIVAAGTPRTVETAEFHIERRGLPPLVTPEMETAPAGAWPDSPASGWRGGDDGCVSRHTRIVIRTTLPVRRACPAAPQAV
ncbi:MAG: hypothetical protein OXH75_11090 [Acidobacteria bacterium]|nr:hypothetical protein [Acidobacteriota bacterium]